MARRSVSSFVSRNLDLRLSDLSSRTQVQASRGEPHATLSTQLNFRRPDIEVIAFN
jgi:hypothetical protein